jgi:hypothetical protein
LNGTHELLPYADNTNLLRDNMKQSRETLFDAITEVGPERNLEKTKYMLVSHYQNADKSWDIYIGN